MVKLYSMSGYSTVVVYIYIYICIVTIGTFEVIIIIWKDQ